MNPIILADTDQYTLKAIPATDDTDEYRTNDHQTSIFIDGPGMHEQANDDLTAYAWVEAAQAALTLHNYTDLAASSKPRPKASLYAGCSCGCSSGVITGAKIYLMNYRLEDHVHLYLELKN